MSKLNSVTRALLACMAMLVAASAQAQIVYEFTVPVDVDNDPLSGCSLATPDGAFDGAEFSIITEVTAMGASAMVTGVSESTCSGGVFGPPQVINAGGWPVGSGNGDGGGDVVESVAGIPGGMPRATSARLGLVTSGIGLDDALITDDGTAGGGAITLGLPPFVIPTLTFGGVVVLALLIGGAAVYLRRRHGLLVTLVVAGMAVSFSSMGVLRALAPDGMIDDWIASQLLATDASADGSPDIISFYGQPIGAETVFLRFDAILNAPPNAVDDPASITEDAAPNTVAGNVLTNDDDGGDGPDPLMVTTPGMTSGAFGTLDLLADGNFTFTLDNTNAQVNALNVGDSLVDTFGYTISDGAATASANVIITINGANDAPVANDDAGAVQEDITLNDTGNVLNNDSDVDNVPGDLTVTTTGMQAGTYGDVMLGAMGGFNYTLANGNANVQALAQGETQTDTFPYTMSDGSLTAGANLVISVTGNNDAPVAVADPGEVATEDTPAVLDVLGNDTDVDNGAVLSVMSVDTTGTQGMVINNGGDVTYNAPQSLPMGGMLMDTFSYIASDEFSAASGAATVTVTATGLNDPPVAAPDAVGTDEDTAIMIDVLGNDMDVDMGDVLMVVSVDTTGTMGMVTNNGTDVTYSPVGLFDALVAGQMVQDTFDYSVTDGITADVSTVTVTVTGVNDPPVLTMPSPFITFVEGDAPRIVDPIAGVTDVDSVDFDGGQLRVELITNGTPNDRLGINSEPPGTGIETIGGNVIYLGTTIGTFAGGTDGSTPLVVDLSSANATPVAVRQLVRNITFENVASPPNTMDRTVEFRVTDGDGAGSGPVTETIEVALPSTCDGAVVNNECWWLGNNGETCDQVCSIHGGYNAATETFAGSGGSAAQCEQVMLALNAEFGNPPNPTPATPATGDPVGCASDFSGNATTLWYSSPATTAAGSATNHRRACACNDQPPPQTLSYAGPYSLPRAIMITPIAPTFTGYVDSWSIAPPLPAGLNFNTSTGVITGTPTTVTANTTYTVTASNAGGDLMATFDLAVIAAPPSGLNYPNAPFSFPVNNAIATQLPSVVGQVDMYSIAPALPTGLNFNTTTGAITGNPTVASPAANYTVTATNIDGSDMTTFSLEVTAVVLNCNGVVVGGFCWWGGLNGDSCTDVCSGKGGYNAATQTYAGSGGNNAQCGAVMTALEAMFGSPANPTPVTTDSGLAVGCASDYSGIANTRRHTSPATTAGATATNHRRACACNSQPAPSGLSYAGSPFAFPQGVDIGTVSPTVTNFVQSWSISPAIPTGLSFNTSTGEITGTPTTLQGPANYTVTASNAGGSDMVTISIAVTGQPPMNLNYPFDPYIFNVGDAISAQVPTVTGTVNMYSISPALPSGLSFNTSTGAITGTPTATSPATNYTVTATNGAGNDMEVISIQVNAALTCGGTVAGGWCWYFGTNGQSCDTVCGTHGGTTNGTISFAGSGGTTDHCAHVAFEVNADTGGPFNPLPASTDGTNLGCHSDYASVANTIRGTAATSQAATGTFIRRLCSCAN